MKIKKEKKQNTGLHSIYVGNLNYRSDENHLLGLFKKFGFIKNINIVIDKKTKRSKGIAFVDMVVLEDAEKAIKALDGSLQFGRTIKVSMADKQNIEEMKAIEEKKNPPIETPSKKNLDNAVKKERRIKKKRGLDALLSLKK